jgi:DNA-binding MarR family transcriptional regulator
MAPHASPADRLADRLHSTAIHLLRRVRKDDESLGLSAARLSALSVIVFAGPIRMSALARAEQVKVPTMTLLVAALQEAGLVTRRPDPSDARAVLLQATSKGEKLMAEGRRRRVARLAAELARLSAADQARVERAVEVLDALFKPQP